MKKHKKNIILWLLYTSLLFLLYKYIANTDDPIEHTLTFVILQFLAFCINLKVLFPKFFDVKKYFYFTILNVLLIVIGAYGNTFFEDRISHSLIENHYTFEVLLAHSVPVFIGIFLALINHNYNESLKREKKEKERIAAEKSFLVQQINPHFLFNTLNNIYSLTFDNNPKASKAVLQLSKMLDYSLYGNKEEYVLLTKEIQYITNFIDLFKLKDDKMKNIHFEYSNINKHSKIAPMLLLPFVENAFKHGNIEDLNEGKIKIIISSTEKEINFLCKNTFSVNKKVDAIGGIGIKNVARRLELLYKDKHQLRIDKIKDEFKVDLKIYV